MFKRDIFKKFWNSLKKAIITVIIIWIGGSLVWNLIINNPSVHVTKHAINEMLFMLVIASPFIFIHWSLSEIKGRIEELSSKIDELIDDSDDEEEVY